MEPLMPPLSTTSTRERLTLTLMPTPSARLPLDFFTPTLLPPDMPTTPDTSPTPLIPPTLSTTPMLPMPPMLDTLDTPDTPDSMPSARGMLTLMPTIGQVAAGLPYANAVATGHAHNPGHIAYTSFPARSVYNTYAPFTTYGYGLNGVHYG